MSRCSASIPKERDCLNKLLFYFSHFSHQYRHLELIPAIAIVTVTIFALSLVVAVISWLIVAFSISTTAPSLSIYLLPSPCRHSILAVAIVEVMLLVVCIMNNLIGGTPVEVTIVSKEEWKA